MSGISFAAVAHLLVSLVVVVSVILLAAWSKITGPDALIVVLAVTGISAPANLLTSATVAAKE